MELWRSERLAVRCLDVLKEAGLKVQVTSDFSAARAHMIALKKSYNTPLLDHENVAFTRNSSFWLLAEKQGVPAMGAGVRIDDLGEESFSNYFVRTSLATFGAQPSVGMEIDYPEIRRKIAYMGDLKVESSRKLSGKDHAHLKLFSFYCHHRCFADHRVDVTYCFMREKDAHDRGAPQAYGFFCQEPFKWTWAESPFGGGTPEWIGYLPREKYPSLMSSIQRTLSDQFAIDDDFV